MKNYIKPIIEIEGFVTNEYVAACLAFNCTTGDEWVGYEGMIKEDSNNNNIAEATDDTLTYVYTCGGNVILKEYDPNETIVVSGITMERYKIYEDVFWIPDLNSKNSSGSYDWGYEQAIKGDLIMDFKKYYTDFSGKHFTTGNIINNNVSG